MPLLKKGQLLGSPTTKKCYQVASHLVARGGFGEVYKGFQLDNHRDPVEEVAIKVGLDPMAWHGEAYFGRLLEGRQQVVQLRDAFQLLDGAGALRNVRYILIFDWMPDGTVEQALRAKTPWPERQVAKQIGSLLDVLDLLHRRGICHGDITPGNVFVHKTRLLLGDLGIAKQGLDSGPVTMDGASPPVFQPPDVLPWRWSPSDDVYQVGLIALSLLAGEVVTSNEVCGKVLRSLDASDGIKGWIRDCLQARTDRFEDAHEAYTFLREPSIRAFANPRGLRDQLVVFTGTLPITRAMAKSRAKRAGAAVQDHVNGQTTLVVAGQPNPLMIGQRAGTKLFDAHRRIRRGQRIAIIGAKQFERLLT